MTTLSNSCNRLVIGLSGFIGTGKTTVARALVDRIPGAAILSFGALVKQEASEIYGYPLEWNDTPEGKSRMVPLKGSVYAIDSDGNRTQWDHEAPVRVLLQYHGTHVGRERDPDCWVKALDRMIAVVDADVVVIDDVRFPNEFDYIKQSGGIVVRLEPFPGWQPTAAHGHVGEHMIDAHDFDLVARPPYGHPEQIAKSIYHQLLYGGTLRATCTPPRPDIDTWMLDMADMVSFRSTCKGRRVGAVLAMGPQILATGYNGAPSSVEHCVTCIRRDQGIPSGTRHEICNAVHAEMNCIIQSALHGVAIGGATLYCNVAPCSLCARSIINAKITRVVFRTSYPDPLTEVLMEKAGYVRHEGPGWTHYLKDDGGTQ